MLYVVVKKEWSYSMCECGGELKTSICMITDDLDSANKTVAENNEKCKDEYLFDCFEVIEAEMFKFEMSGWN